MSDDHSEVVPLLPIPNRTVKRFCANDSAGSRVKVGHRQTIKPKTPSRMTGRFFTSVLFVYSNFLFVWLLHQPKRILNLFQTLRKIVRTNGRIFVRQAFYPRRLSRLDGGKKRLSSPPLASHLGKRIKSGLQEVL